MDRFKNVFRFWFAWDSEKIEDYLEDMSLRGWHVAHVDGLLVNFLFERGEPGHIRYCMDYQQADKAEYQQIFKDAGWTLLQKSMGWYLWSMAYDGARPHIYTDTDSLIRRNKSLIFTMMVILIAQGPALWLNISNLTKAAAQHPTTIMMLVAVLVGVYSLLIYCVVRLFMSIRKLKRRKL